MFNFAPLGEFVVFVLAIAVIIGCAVLGVLAIIVKYILMPFSVIFCIGLVLCAIKQCYIKIKSLLKKKDVEKELN